MRTPLAPPLLATNAERGRPVSSPFHAWGLRYPASVRKWGMQGSAQRYTPLPWPCLAEQDSEHNDRNRRRLCPSLPV